MNEPAGPATEERQALIAEARKKYGSDTIEIDDNAEISQAEEGAWVAAWLWISAPAPLDNP